MQSPLTGQIRYKWVTTEDFIEFMDRNADGAAYPAIRPERIGEGTMLVPTPDVPQRFEAICQPLTQGFIKGNVSPKHWLLSVILCCRSCSQARSD